MDPNSSSRPQEALDGSSGEDDGERGPIPRLAVVSVWHLCGGGRRDGIDSAEPECRAAKSSKGGGAGGHLVDLGNVAGAGCDPRHGWLSAVGIALVARQGGRRRGRFAGAIALLPGDAGFAPGRGGVPVPPDAQGRAGGVGGDPGCPGAASG